MKHGHYPLYLGQESGFDEDNILGIFCLLLMFEEFDKDKVIVLEKIEGNCYRENCFKHSPTYPQKVSPL